MGTYSDESPDAGVVERTVNSIKKIVGLPKDPTKTETKNPTAGGETPQETANRMSSDADTSSNTGAAGQSTDAYNKY